MVLYYLKLYLQKSWQLLQKIFLAVVIYSLVISLFFVFTKKGNSQKNNNYEISKSNYAILDQPQYNSNPEGKKFVAVTKSLLCFAVGESCTNNPDDDKKNFKTSLFGIVTDALLIPYANPPASGLYWAYSGLQQAGFIPKTYAANNSTGIGFASLSLFMPIWKTFRNLVYVIMVLIIISIGLMIMLKVKINPQTVVNIENSLPKIVIAMLLITFSYAIAGFLIDLMYIATLIVINIMAPAGNLNLTDTINTYLNKGLIDIIALNFNIYFAGLNAFYNILPNMIKGIISIVLNFLTLLLVYRIASKIGDLGNALGAEASVGISLGAEANINLARLISTIIGIITGVLLGPIILYIIFMFIVIIGLLFLFFRIFFLLLYSYIQIIVYIMFAPLLIITEAIPGRSGFMPWLKNILGNLITFPVVIGLFLTLAVIDKQINLQGYSTNMLTGTTNIFIPPLISSNYNLEYVIPIINAVFLLMIPDLTKNIRQMIVGKTSLPAVAPNVLLGGVGGAVGSSVGLLGQISSINMGAQALKNWLNIPLLKKK